ncbi:MAG: hypothetical protein H7Z13_01640 [Ferruginibacter sp.]|nr:hypothetical protein [Ferruginibacter sp.]
MFLNNRKKNRLVPFIIMASLLAGSCMYDKEELLYPGVNTPPTCATVPASFNADILPLITNNCASPGCHDASASGGRIFQNYNQISGAKDRINIRAVVQKSMPASGPLSPAEINKIKCWIEAGALNN